MGKISCGWRAFVAWCVLGVATGCGASENSEQPLPQAESIEDQEARSPPARFTDEDGTQYIRVKKAKFAKGPFAPRQPVVREAVGANGERVLTTEPAARRELDIPNMPVEEVAAMLRGLTLRDGYEYIEEALPIERAQKLQEEMRRGVPLPSTRPGVVAEAEVEPGTVVGQTDRVVIPRDSRTYRGGNRGFPNSTQLYMPDCGCSATMIGRRIAISAAHCIYDWETGNWCNAQSLIPAADNGSNPRPFGTLTGFTITIPSSNLDDNDYIRIKFPTAVGDSTSWLGTTDSSSGTMEVVGYPADKPRPQLWGGTGTVTSTSGTFRKHNVDTFDGQSGSGLYRLSDFLVVGIHVRGGFTQSCAFWVCGSKNYFNEAVRWNAALHSFVAASGVWPD